VDFSNCLAKGISAEMGGVFSDLTPSRNPLKKRGLPRSNIRWNPQVGLKPPTTHPGLVAGTAREADFGQCVSDQKKVFRT